eukprot:1176579-Prorocentrum_minimum.AAC.12
MPRDDVNTCPRSAHPTCQLLGSLVGGVLETEQVSNTTPASPMCAASHPRDVESPPDEIMFS